MAIISVAIPDKLHTDGGLSGATALSPSLKRAVSSEAKI